MYYSLRFTKGTRYIISADPLTTLPAVLLRKLGWYKFHYYHCIDFSTDRFHNDFLNKVYASLIKFGLQKADLIGVVTKVAQNKLTRLTTAPIEYMPNSPSFDDLAKYRLPIVERQPYSLVVSVSEVSHKYMIHKLVEITAELRNKYPKIAFHVIGPFGKDSYYQDVKNYVDENQLGTNVIFHGGLSREENYRTIGKCLIGLAFYDGKFSHVQFGDALKIREYAALGLACIADKQTTTGIEAGERQCGFAVDSIDEAASKISELLDNASVYQASVDNALRWAKENDKDVLVRTLVQKYFKLSV
jgi:glycosyltransferase involved in cell wall biosynthesis